MHQCRIFLDHLQRGTAPWVAQRLRSTYGAPPTDPSSFSFFVAFVLPIDEQEKAKLLPIRSPRLRLLLVVHWIEQLNNNWYKERTLMNCILLMVLSVSFFYLRAAGGAGGF
jgi:Lon protease-like protein